MAKVNVRRFVVWGSDNNDTIIESDDMACALYSAKEEWINFDWETKKRIELEIQEIDENGRGFGETMTENFEVGADKVRDLANLLCETPEETKERVEFCLARERTEAEAYAAAATKWVNRTKLESGEQENLK